MYTTASSTKFINWNRMYESARSLHRIVKHLGKEYEVLLPKLEYCKDLLHQVNITVLEAERHKLTYEMLQSRLERLLRQNGEYRERVVMFADFLADTFGHTKSILQYTETRPVADAFIASGQYPKEARKHIGNVDMAISAAEVLEDHFGSMNSLPALFADEIARSAGFFPSLSKIELPPPIPSTKPILRKVEDLSPPKDIAYNPNDLITLLHDVQNWSAAGRDEFLRNNRKQFIEGYRRLFYRDDPRAETMRELCGNFGIDIASERDSGYYDRFRSLVRNPDSSAGQSSREDGRPNIGRKAVTIYYSNSYKRPNYFPRKD